MSARWIRAGSRAEGDPTRSPSPGPAALLALLAACGGGEATAPEAAEPHAANVVLIVADTLRADRLGCYGYERDTSPAIDRLADEGVLFENCHSQACWTVPSMISLMSGLPVTQKETVLPEVPVLAQALSAKGFETAAFLANAAVGVDRGFERGFDHFGECFDWRADAVVEAFEAWYRGWLEREPRQRFFAWVHFVDPHHPYEPEARFAEFEGPRPDYAALEPRWLAAAPRLEQESPGLEGPPAAEAAARMNDVSNRYDGEVRAVDAGVGRLLELLEQTGQRERTLVVFCSDHGEMLYEQENFPYLVQQRIEEHGGLPDGVMDLFAAGHRPWYYEHLWRTPLIFSGPGMPAGVRRDGLAANLDIYPTVLEALGLEVPEHLRGESLLGGRRPEREHVFAYGHRTTAVLDARGQKLVVHWPRSYLLPKQSPAPLQLFDLSGDPRELDNLAAEEPARAAELLEAIEAWRGAHERQVIDAESERMREKLRQMGYLGDDPGEDDPDGE